MKKKISTMLLSFAMVVSCLFTLVACGKDKNPPTPPPTVTAISVELTNTNYVMTNNTISVVWGGKVELSASDFKVTATKSDSTTEVLASNAYALASSLSDDAVTPVGSYTLTFSYPDVTDVVVTVTVSQARIDMSEVTWNYDPNTFVYSGQKMAVELVGVPAGVTVTYRNNEATDAGSYVSYADFAVADTYEPIDSMQLEWEIKKADYDIDALNLELENFVYDGTEKTTRLKTTLPSGLSATVIAVSSVTSATKGGTYEVVFAFELGDNASNYNTIPNKTLTWRIAPKPVAAAFATEFVYTGAEQTLTAADFTLPEGVSITEITNNKRTNAGSQGCTLRLAFTPEVDGCYQKFDLGVTWVIARAPLEIRAEDITISYGEQIPEVTITYTGFVSGEDEDNLDGTLAIDMSDYPGTGYGSFDIVISGCTSNNYEITRTNGTLTINPIRITTSTANWDNVGTYTYNEGVQAPVLENLPASLPQGFEVDYKYEVYDYSQQKWVEETPINAGQYKATATFVVPEGYEADKLSFEVEYYIERCSVNLAVNVYWTIDGVMAKNNGNEPVVGYTNQTNVELFNNTPATLDIDIVNNPEIERDGTYDFVARVRVADDHRTNYDDGIYEENGYVEVKLTYLVYDLILRFNAEYVSLATDSAPATAQITLNSSTPTVIQNAIWTGIAPELIPSAANYTCRYFKDVALENEVVFTEVGSFNKIYAALYDEMGAYLYTRVLELGTEFIVGDNQFATSEQYKSFAVAEDASEFGFAIVNANTRVTEFESKVSVDDAIYSLSVELSSNYTKVYYSLSLTYNSEVYSYSTEFAVTRTIPVSTHFEAIEIPLADGSGSENADTNEFDGGYDISTIEQLDASSIIVQPAAGYDVSTEPGDEQQIVNLDGCYFLKITLVESAAPQATGEGPTKYVCYIRLFVAGILDSNTNVVKTKLNNRTTYFGVGAPINVNVGDEVYFRTENEYAVINLVDAMAQEIINSDRGEFYNMFTSTGYYAIEIVSTDESRTTQYIFNVTGSGSGMPGEEQGDPSSAVVEIIGCDFFANEIAVEYDSQENTLVLENWNIYNELIVVTEHQQATVELYADPEGEPIFSDYATSFMASLVIPEPGTYYLVIISADQSAYRTITVTVTGDYPPLVEVYYDNGTPETTDDVTIYESMDLEYNQPIGDFDMLYDLTGENSFGSFVGYLGLGTDAKTTTEGGKEYFTITSIRSSIVEYLSSSSDVADAIVSPNNVKLEVKAETVGSTTFKYVEFYMVGEIEIAPDVIEKVSMCNKVYLTSREYYEANREYPVKLTLGGTDYDVQIKPKEWYSFGELEMHSASTTEYTYIETTREALGIDALTNTINVTITWTNVFANDGYVVLNQNGFEGIAAGSTLSSIIAAGDAHRSAAGSLTATISITFVDGVAMIAMTDETGWLVIPIYIFISDEIDWLDRDSLSTSFANVNKIQMTLTTAYPGTEPEMFVPGDTISVQGGDFGFIPVPYSVILVSNKLDITIEEARVDFETEDGAYSLLMITSIEFGDENSFVCDSHSKAEIDTSEGFTAGVYNTQFGVVATFEVMFNGYINALVYIQFSNTSPVQ